jgi:hypothetical protein
MSLDTNFNVNPYYDDFDEDKKFLRVVFKPGYAVQARELTQLQTLSQKQIDRFGQHVFQNGSRVLGCQTVIQDATYINLTSTYITTDVLANNFVGQTILSSDESKRAEVIKVYESNAGTGEPITLMVKQLYGDAFTSGETIKTNETNPTFANTSGVGTGQTYSVNDGVFFYDGFFIKNSPQTIALSKYSNSNSNVKIGFEITESIVKSTSDTSLLDPAQDASNYQAPGADRYKIDLVLATRALDSTDLEQFIELARVEESVLAQDNRYPLYSVLEDSLARRTFDESGNYTVTPFKLTLNTNSTNTAQTDVILSPGKAYVYGYEFETIFPTTITIDNPRDETSVTNKFLSADYGYFVYTKDQFNTFPVNSLDTVDIHCVPVASINTATTSTISNTKIGTARVKGIEFESSSDSANSQTYVYRTYLFDVNINNSITGIVRSANAGNVTIANTTAGQIFTSITDAYAGAKLRITSGNGSNEAPKTITAFDATNQRLTLDSNFVTIPNGSSTFAIDFEFNDAEALAVYSSTTKVAAANLDTRSKDTSTPYDDVVITDSKLEPLVFEIGEKYIVDGTIADMTMNYRRFYQSQIFVGDDSPALTVGTGEALSSATTTSAKEEEYIVVVTSAGTSPYSVGSIVPASNVSVDTGTRKITVTNANNMTANIVATISLSNPTKKTKTSITANSTIQTSGGEDIFSNGAVYVYSTQGQTTIAKAFVVKTPDTTQSLYVSDAYELIQVLDYNNAAVANTGGTDVTERYTLDNGQRDSYYDHSAIKLKPGFLPAVGPLVVRYKRFTSSGSGFFTVDSYADYNTIPDFVSPVTGQAYNLRDCLDFRPVRKDATAILGSSVVFDVDASTTGPKIPTSGSDIILDYNYYMPRNDRIVLNKNKVFEVVKGTSSLSPQLPKEPDNSMTLYNLRMGPYIIETNEIQAEFVNHKRYTMRDIGTLEKRIDNLEYYTTLTALEQDTLNKQDYTIKDSANLTRFKNGFIADGFKGFSVADVYRNEYRAGIDTLNKTLRPSSNSSAHTLTFDSANSSNFLQTGPWITAPATTVEFINQSYASRTINVNPFNLVNYLGVIQLNPPSDIWVDTTVSQPEPAVNLFGELDAWNKLSQIPFDITLTTAGQSWWTGQTTSETGDTYTTSNSGRRAIYQDTTVYQDRATQWTGTAQYISTSAVTQSIGDRVVDVSVIPYMRNISTLFVAHAFKPDTTLYPFFDNISVEKYVARANKFVMEKNDLSYNTKTNNFERVNIVNTGTATTLATAIVVVSSNDTIYLTNVNPSAPINIATANIVGTVSGSSYRIASYHHYSGLVQAATANTITLRLDVSGAANEGFLANVANSNTISIVAGTGAGQQATISSYSADTRVLSITGSWTKTPDTTSVYSIGRLRTDLSGVVAGIYSIPAGIFRTGEKSFTLTDASTGDIPSSSTSGSTKFFAQGVLQTKQDIIVSTIQASTTTKAYSQVKVESNVVKSRQTDVVGWIDPVAQTFLISPQNFPDGLFIDKVRVCFKTKDESVPVTLQLRPVDNGYPSSAVIYPYGIVTLTPDKVKISDTPNFTDPTKYTDFVFDAPVYMQPGEHSFVLIANSNKYEVYAAEIGKLDIVGGKQISEQPYGGSLFLSQNGSTWTADQNMDLMFQLFRKNFSTSPVTARFLVNTPASNTNIDLLQLITSDIKIGGTKIDYKFNAQDTGGTFAGFKTLEPLQMYNMNDGDGRRTMFTTQGNNTFVVEATMSTDKPEISPVIDTTRFGILAFDNYINDLPLTSNNFTITVGGSGYTGNANVTIIGGGGSGANAYAVVANGNVTSIVVDSAGSGYITSPTITIGAPSVPGGNVTATATFNGEDKKSGGNAVVRYITRKIVLNDGFDSSDLRVYMTAYKPQGSEIYVFYKILSNSDPETFNDKNYQLMTRIGANFVSTTESDKREMVFAPGVNGLANNSVSYTSGTTSYKSFRTFAIKVVMVGNDPVDVPVISDFRSIAYPAA